jgi:hypothetical protein
MQVSLSTAKTTASSSATTFVVDQAKPLTTIQIRLQGGSKVEATFNQAHTIGDLRSYLEREHGLREPYTLRMAYPRKVLDDPTQTLAGAGLLNALVIHESR